MAQPKKYNEFELTYRDGKIFRKDLTERGHVMIDEYTAKLMNERTKNTGLLYELAEEKNEKEYRKELFEKAKELDLTPAKNMKTEDLEQLIKDNE